MLLPPPRPVPLFTPRRAAIALTALSAASFTHTLVVRAYPTVPVAVVGWTLALALGGGFTARHALQRGGRISAAVGASALCGAITMLLASLLTDTPSAPDLTLVVSAAMTAGGGTLGAVFGLASLSAVRPAVSVEETPSFDGLERVLLSGSIWPGLLGWVDLAWGRNGGVALVLSCAALLLVAARDLRRVLWLRGVARGDVAGWSIALADDGAAAGPPIPRFGAHDAAALDARLVYQRGREVLASPFRATTDLLSEPIAALPRNLRSACAPFLRRAALALLATAALIGMVVAERG